MFSRMIIFPLTFPFAFSILDQTRYCTASWTLERVFPFMLATLNLSSFDSGNIQIPSKASETEIEFKCVYCAQSENSFTSYEQQVGFSTLDHLCLDEIVNPLI